MLKSGIPDIIPETRFIEYKRILRQGVNKKNRKKF